MRFDRLPEQVGLVETEIGELRSYPQVLRGSPDYIRQSGHLPLRRLVENAMATLTRRWSFVSVDTRLSMLMPGMYPCIPGWHCDDFHRPNGGQPDLAHAPQAEHVCLIIGNCSRTRFVAQELDLPMVTDTDLEGGRTLYGVMHRRIEQCDPKTFQVSSGEMWRFSPKTWHRGEPATEAGWRYFLRLTGSDHWTPLNQRRTQTQVYLTEPFRGW